MFVPGRSMARWKCLNGEQRGQWGGTSELGRFPPPGATSSGSAELQSSELTSRTRSVSAFLLSRASTGPRSSGEVAPISDSPLKQSEKAWHELQLS